jgi:hypothetical protein
LTARIDIPLSRSARLGRFQQSAFEEQAMTDLDRGLNDEDVQKVLARALELQAQRSEVLTVAQIREIASDLAIPESAVDQALSEYRGAAVARASGTPATTAVQSFPGRRRAARLLMVSMGVVGSALTLLLVVSLIIRLLFP